jgi:hypothetical protein
MTSTEIHTASLGLPELLIWCRNKRSLHKAAETPEEYAQLREMIRGIAPYKVSYVPKGDDPKGRLIEDPNPAARRVIAQVQVLLEKVAVHPNAVGFVRGLSLHDGRKHLYWDSSRSMLRESTPQWVLTVDYTDAFHSINKSQIRGILNKETPLSKFAKHLVISACTRNGRLAVGSPVSPMMLNLHLRPLDETLTTLIEKLGGTYRRYADDLTFYIPKSRKGRRGKKDTTIDDVKRLKKKILREIRDFGMTPNPRKTSLTRVTAKQAAEVLGTTVRLDKTETVAVYAPTRKTKRKARAARHHLLVLAKVRVTKGETGKGILKYLHRMRWSADDLTQIGAAIGVLGWEQFCHIGPPRKAGKARRVKWR